MASMTAATLTALQEHLIGSPTIKLFTRDSAEFASLQDSFALHPERTPFAIVRPQSAKDVETLVEFVRQNDINFTIRVGGYDCPGRSQVKDSLTIDLRDISYVKIDETKTTARVGGGTLVGQVMESLGEHGVVTPCPTIANIGYVGWATLGGYGPFAPLHGLGVDQIVAAKLVDPTGTLVEANEEVLRGIRGAGGIFGVIVEVTIKVYPLRKMLASLVIYDSTDMRAVWTNVTQGFQALIDEKALPSELQVQLFGFNLPNLGKVLTANVTWAGEDHDEGQLWIQRIASLSKCVMNQPHETTLADWVNANQKTLAGHITGGVRPLNFRKWTPKSAEILAKHHGLFAGVGLGLMIHSLRLSQPNTQSVFGSRHEHLMVEVMKGTEDVSMQENIASWSQAVVEDLLENDPDNILESSYVCLTEDHLSDYRKIYGGHYETLLMLKSKFDPDNVFGTAVPSLRIS